MCGTVCVCVWVEGGQELRVEILSDMFAKNMNWTVFIFLNQTQIILHIRKLLIHNLNNNIFKLTADKCDTVLFVHLTSILHIAKVEGSNIN